MPKDLGGSIRHRGSWVVPDAPHRPIAKRVVLSIEGNRTSWVFPSVILVNGVLRAVGAFNQDAFVPQLSDEFTPKGRLVPV